MIGDSQTGGMQHIYEIYDMWHVPWWQTMWVHYSILVVGLIVLFLVAWYGIQKIREKKRQTSPWGKALKDLEDLRIQGFVSVVYSKELYTALTHILKHYLYERYGFDIVAKTDDEAIAFLEKSSLPLELLQPIRIIFNGSIVIKFANACAIKTQIEQDFAASRDIIYKTIPDTK